VGDLINRDGLDAILFDLDGTLRINRPTFNQALISYAVELDIPENAENGKRALRWLHYYWASSPELTKDLDTYETYGEQFWNNHARLYLLAYGCAGDQATQFAPELYKRMVEGYNPEDWLAEGVPAILQALKTNGFRLAVVSNRTNPFDEQLETLGIQDYFELALAAGAIDAWKPDPAIFQHALTLMGLEPAQAIYVGDNYFADVIGAQNAGMQSVLVDPEGLFPEADCQVIPRLNDLKFALEK
jgi:HAD superfamily hydrolase (TIGR01549 family)